MKKLLVIEKIKIQEANAFSSPYTIGFPAMTTWLGFMHKLQRELSKQFINFKFKKIGIISNDFNCRLYKSKNYFRHVVIEKRHPLTKDGKTESFIEDPMCNLTVSLIIEYENLKKNEEEDFLIFLKNILESKLKIAGGNIFGYKKIFLERINEEKDEATREFLRKINFGYALINRNEYLIEDMIANNINAMDSLISFLEVKSQAVKNDNDEVEWISYKKKPGWLVPISVGYQGITDLAKVKNQRDNNYLHCFAEAIVTLGEFIMPYRLKSIDDMLWQYEFDAENKLYICK